MVLRRLTATGMLGLGVLLTTAMLVAHNNHRLKLRSSRKISSKTRKCWRRGPVHEASRNRSVIIRSRRT